jgi:hypothetical protein
MRWHRYPDGNAASEACAAHILERHTLEGEYRPSEFPAQTASRGAEADWKHERESSPVGERG